MKQTSKRSVAKGDFSLEDMLGLITSGLNNPKSNNFQYVPHKKQLIFHKSEKNGRQYIGGNRSGKTTGGINEDIWWLTGRHPFIKLPPPPLMGRVITVDFKNGLNKIILPQLAQWIPPSDLINGSWTDSWNGQNHNLTLANGSQLEVMSYDQELEKFAGVPRHFMHFDEEPPFDIFKECKARLVDYNGRWWMTMTPVEGMTWTYDEIWEKRSSDLIDVVTVDIHDNPHLGKEAIDSLLEGYDEDEKLIRGAGQYVAVSGLIFKHFVPEVHVIPEGIPNAREWEHYMSLDAGFNNPTAILRHAVHRQTGVVVTYAEHYRSEWTVQQHAEKIKSDEAYLLRDHGIVPFLRIADPAIKQRQQTTGLSIQIEYSQHGINLATGAVKDVKAGLDKMNNYFRLGKWFITENCTNTIREHRKYKWAAYATSKLREKNNKKEEPVKKDDHTCDSARYFFSFMPELSPEAPSPRAIVRPSLLPGAPTHFVNKLNTDPNFDKSQDPVFVIDEYVGEW